MTELHPHPVPFCAQNGTSLAMSELDVGNTMIAFLKAFYAGGWWLSRKELLGAQCCCDV